MLIRLGQLSNGLKIVTAHMPGFDTATVAAIANAGSTAEMPSEHGIAHFLEHMAFKGTKNRTALDISQEIELLGSEMNAFTSSDMTTFYMSGLATSLPKHIDILGDILMHSAFTADDINMECGVIQQEIKRYQDNPQSVCVETLDALVYQGHPLGRSVLGTLESVASFGPDHFRAFVARNYTADNVVIFVAGGVDHDQVVAMVENAFGEFNASSSQVLRPSKPTFYGGEAIIRDRPFEQASIMMSLEAVGLNSPNKQAFTILDRAFGGGMSSPLFQEVREKRGLVYSVGAFADMDQYSGRFIIHAGTTTEHVDELIRVSMGELVKIANDGVQELDFQRAMNSTRVQLATLKEKQWNLIMTLANWYFATGELVTPEAKVQEIESVTRDDLRDMAQLILKSEPALCIVGPVGDTYIETMRNAMK